MVEFVAPGEPFLGKGRMRAMAQGQRDYLQFDRKLAQADGSTFWTRLTTSAVRDEEENFLHAVRMVEDISDLVDAHEQLRTSELRQRELFEAAPIGITISDADRIMPDVNPALAAMLGVPAQEIIGNRFGKFASPEWEHPAVRPFDQMLAGATDRIVVDRPYIRANGNTMWARTTASAVRDDQGAFLYAIGTVEDITDRRAVEQDLAASREQLVLTNARNESILASAGEGIIAWDSRGAIVSINPAATAMMRVAAAEAIGSRPSDIVTLRTAEGSAFGDDEHILSLVLHDGETRTTIAESMERKDGSTVVIDRVGTAQRDATGTRVVGGVITMRDVSDRAEIEKAKAGFFAATSHGLRTPLTAIHASIGFVASGVLGGLPERAARQIDIAVDASSDLVSCDAALITQVLTNLLGNAIKYSPAGSTINVTALADDRVITVAVSDPGPGIPPESIPTLFEEFQRVDSIANREQQGTGLGLAIAKAIVERHHGRIWVDSVLGQGSTFRFTLPPALARARDAPLVSPAHAEPVEGPAAPQTCARHQPAPPLAAPAGDEPVGEPALSPVSHPSPPKALADSANGRAGGHNDLNVSCQLPPLNHKNPPQEEGASVYPTPTPRTKNQPSCSPHHRQMHAHRPARTSLANLSSCDTP